LGKLCVQGQPGLHNETLSQTNKKKRKEKERRKKMKEAKRMEEALIIITEVNFGKIKSKY
jgi:hypothetical protein